MKFLDRIKELSSTIKRSDQLKTKVAADLAILIARAGLKRKQIAQRLEISEAALSIKLSGTQNLTLESISSISEAAGFDFDVVFRTTYMPRAHSFFELEEPRSEQKLADIRIRKVKGQWRAPVFNSRMAPVYTLSSGLGAAASAAANGDCLKFASNA
ncbi:hypothetical protein [Roseateles sp. P5_E1]